ncbi:uncharacterized protein ACMZJ9_002554 [Mantella aurantiaca]
MTTSMRMEEDQSHMTERILNLTLEIIYLLTGESYPLVKSDDQVTIMVPPPHSLKPERNYTKKILEVTQKMIGVLTGEVPIRCQDVTVYFSMEEWEYLEGHKDLYKDVMMDNQPPLTSPDGSSNRNPPERCPCPLYSQDSTQEDLTIPHHHQVNGNQPERCPRPLYSQDSTHLTIPDHHQRGAGECGTAGVPGCRYRSAYVIVPFCVTELFWEKKASGWSSGLRPRRWERMAPTAFFLRGVNLEDIV